jgi:hypothetical protein
MKWNNRTDQTKPSVSFSICRVWKIDQFPDSKQFENDSTINRR